MKDKKETHSIISLSILLISCSVIFLQGCFRPYPIDMRMTLTVSVSEVLPTATGFAETIGKVTPALEDNDQSIELTQLPSELVGGSPFYAIVLVGADNLLNVRAAPGIDQAILETFEPNKTNIKLTGNSELVGDDLWVEIEREDGNPGWVSSDYLTQQVPSNAFCTNAKIRTLARDFSRAIVDSDEQELAQMVNPERGLSIRKVYFDKEVNFPIDNINKLISSTEEYDWGADRETGESITGSFRKIIFPELRNVLTGEFSQSCNNLDFGIATGPSSISYFWPYELVNMNYLTFYQQPEGESGEWQTWAVGIEVISGIPYITYLIHYAPDEQP